MASSKQCLFLTKAIELGYAVLYLLFGGSSLLLHCVVCLLHVTDLQCARQPAGTVLCGYYVCHWMRVTGRYYNNAEGVVSRSIEPYHMHMFNLLLLI